MKPRDAQSVFDIAYARSGDKGSHVNIGVIAYNLEGYKFLKEYLTEKRVMDYFQGLESKEVLKYELDNLWALNFILKDVLRDSEMRLDSQGKALGQAILTMPIEKQL